MMPDSISIPIDSVFVGVLRVFGVTIGTAEMALVTAICMFLYALLKYYLQLKADKKYLSLQVNSTPLNNAVPLTIKDIREALTLQNKPSLGDVYETKYRILKNNVLYLVEKWNNGNLESHEICERLSKITKEIEQCDQV